MINGWRAIALALALLLGTTGAQADAYQRSDWPHWSDTDRDCRDTRAEMLIAQADGPLGFTTAAHCQVRVGRWVDPYSGQVFTDPKTVDVDHVVALGLAHELGGHRWDRDRREAFANDPDNLLVVSARLNRQKGKLSPSAWLPPRGACAYGRRFVRVVKKYQLRLSPADWQAVKRACEKRR